MKLSTTGLEIIRYGTQGWTEIFKANMELLNDALLFVSAMQDVDLNSLTDDDMLMWDAVSSKFVNKSFWDLPLGIFSFHAPYSSANMSIIEDGLAAIDQVTGWRSVKGKRYFGSEKLYWELTIDILGANGQINGIGSPDASSGSYVGANAYSWGWRSNGTIYHSAGTTSGYSTYTTSDVLMFALDMAAGKFWFGKNGVWEAGGDPAAGTGEQRNDIDQTPLTVMCSQYNSGSKFTLNPGNKAFQHTKPAGFSSLWEASADYEATTTTTTTSTTTTTTTTTTSTTTITA